MRTGMLVARLAGHIIIAGLCLELAARLDDRLSYGAPLWTRYNAESIRSVDDEGLIRNVPGAQFEKWRINALGFRGAPVAFEKAAGRRRIACLGQSESFGLYEREGGEWPAQLARLLSAKHLDAEVVNASVVGLGRDMRQRYIDKYVLPVRPDVLVLYFNVLSDASQRTPAAPGREATMGSPVSAPTTEPPQVSWPESRVLPKLWRRVRAAIPDGIWNPLRAWRLQRSVRQMERAALRGRPPLDVLPPETVGSFERHLRKIISAQRERGIVPVLATYPTLGSAASRSRYRLEFLAQRVWHAEFSDLGMIDAAAKLNDTIRRVASDLAVPLADLDAALPKTPQFFADYVHYTDAGAELVARNVLDALDRSGALDTSPHTTASGGGDVP